MRSSPMRERKGEPQAKTPPGPGRQDLRGSTVTLVRLANRLSNTTIPPPGRQRCPANPLTAYFGLHARLCRIRLGAKLDGCQFLTERNTAIPAE